MKFKIHVLTWFALVISSQNVESRNNNSNPLFNAPPFKQDFQVQEVMSVSEVPDFFLLSLPKSGSHLVLKLLVMLTGQEVSTLGSWGRKQFIQFHKEILEMKLLNQFAFSHLSQHEVGLFNEFANIYPNYLKVVMVRDLRDVFVSLVKHIDVYSPRKWISLGFNSDTSIQEKLSYLINKKHVINGSNLDEHVKNAIQMLNDPSAIVMFFEDLIGPLGGGDAERQNEAIIRLANALNIELSDSQLQEITDNLFGIDTGPTVPQQNFYKGQIGSWKASFNDVNKKNFNEIWGAYQRQLGYELDQ